MKGTQIDLPPRGRLIEVNGFYCVRFGEREFGDWANTEQNAVKLAWDAWEALSGITKNQLRGMLGAAEFVQDFARYEAEMDPSHRSNAYDEAVDILNSLKGIIDDSTLQVLRDVEQQHQRTCEETAVDESESREKAVLHIIEMKQQEADAGLYPPVVSAILGQIRAALTGEKGGS